MNLKLKVYLLSLLHLVVDGLCAYAVFAGLYGNDLTSNYAIFIIYNGMAFAMQPFFGLILDKIKKEKLFLTISIIILLFGVLIPIHFIFNALLIGIANCIFHVVGGKYTVYLNRNKMKYLGIFVAFGATGLSLGIYFYSSALLIIFVSMAIILTILCNLIKDKSSIIGEIPKEEKNRHLPIVIILCVAVMIRSFMGKVTTFSWTINEYYFLALALCASFGKAIGGFLADWIGINKTAIFTLSLACLCYVFFKDILLLGLIGTLLLNTTMPITLFLLNKQFKNREGFSFGLLAGSLFPAYCLGMLFTLNSHQFSIIAFLCLLLTLIIILQVNKMRVKKHV